MTSLNNKDFKLIRDKYRYKVNNWSIRAMKAWDVLHHETLVNNNITLKTIQSCVLEFSAQSLQVHVLEWPKAKHSIKAREAYERNSSSATLPGWVNHKAGSSIVKDRTTQLYNGICAMLNLCASTQKQADIDLSRDRWHQQMTTLINNATWHDTYKFEMIH